MKLDVFPFKCRSTCRAVRSGSGDFPVLSQHLWLGGQEAESTAAALAPKLRKGRDGLQKLLFDVIALEVRRRRCLSL